VKLVKLLEDAGHMMIQIGCLGEGQVSDRLQKNFGQRLKCGEHRCRRRNQAGPACPKLVYEAMDCVLDSQGRTIWIVDAHRDGKRFVVRADEKPTAFLELESAIRSQCGAASIR
jgi:hypothetical protein